MRIIEGEQLTKHFGGLAAVEKVHFHINQGEIVGLIGPNGAGKTTLFNLLSGSLVPTTGTIRFKGENITGLKPYQICRKGMARTFQLVKVFQHMSVLENVLLGSLFGMSPGPHMVDAKVEAEELLELVELSDKKVSLAKDLTVANQKRVEVARALATKPELILLDEVMVGLNPTEVAEFIRLINRIREKGITVLMIEHVMKAIMEISDRIIVLHHGEKIAEGTPQEIANSQEVIKVYLGK
jgi:branched-chain amino acid transport system ATP-binding protein